jgi:hypothetical protein
MTLHATTADGIRSTREGKAYVAGGDRGVRVTLASGETLVVGSQRPEELAAALSGSAAPALQRE